MSCNREQASLRGSAGVLQEAAQRKVAHPVVGQDKLSIGVSRHRRKRVLCSDVPGDADYHQFQWRVAGREALALAKIDRDRVADFDCGGLVVHRHGDDELVVTRVSPSHYLNQDLGTVWLDK